MVFAVNIKGHSSDQFEVLLDIDIFWWDTNELRKDSRFVERYPYSRFFNSYVANLSVDEVKVIHEKYKPLAASGKYANSKWQDIIQPLVTNIDSALNFHSGEYSYFHLIIFEAVSNDDTGEIVLCDYNRAAPIQWLMD